MKKMLTGGLVIVGGLLVWQAPGLIVGAYYGWPDWSMYIQCWILLPFIPFVFYLVGESVLDQ